MDVKEAVIAAKAYIADIFKDEGVFNIGLEEVRQNEDIWEVTIGFSRRWDKPPSNPFSIAVTKEEPDYRALNRTYKIVQIDDEHGNVLGMKNRTGLL